VRRIRLKNPERASWQNGFFGRLRSAAFADGFQPFRLNWF